MRSLPDSDSPAGGWEEHPVDEVAEVRGVSWDLIDAGAARDARSLSAVARWSPLAC